LIGKEVDAGRGGVKLGSGGCACNWSVYVERHIHRDNTHTQRVTKQKNEKLGK